MKSAETLATLERVQELSTSLDLEELDRLACRTATNLEMINGDTTDLEEKDRVVCRIANNLEAIGDDETDLQQLDQVTARVAANLERIAELLADGDVAAALKTKT